MSTPGPGGPSAPADVLARLQTVTDAALGNLPLEKLLDELLTRVRDVLEADTCAVLLLDETSRELVARAAKGIEEEVEQGVRIPVGRGFAGRIAAERRAVIIDDVDHSYVLNPILRQKGIKSLLGIPLLIDGEIIGVMHVGTLTPRKFDAEDIALLQIVGQRVAVAIDRAVAYDEIVRLTELQREFVALAAHELRTPATTVYGLAATLHKRRSQLAPEVLEDLELTLFEQAERLRRLVEQLLDLSRLDNPQTSVAPQAIVLRTHLEEAVAAAAPDRLSDVRVDVAHDLRVMVDPVAVDRVVANLVANAIRYGSPPVIVSADQSDHHLRIYVEDHGHGVAPDFVPYMFERFRRSEEAAHRAAGTGLGLAIARSYARAHGGDLLYAPERDGARFVLVIPAAPVTA